MQLSALSAQLTDPGAAPVPRRYEIYTVSKPATPVAMLALPLLRHYQKKFAAESMAAMQREMAAA